MNYRHAYHAGNFADVAKHVALLYCLEALRRKESAFFALDTHAGRGFYSLDAAEARKSAEADRGVRRLLAGPHADETLQSYLRALGTRPGERLTRYPGSPALIAAALRPQDRATFVERAPAEARALERDLRSAGRIRAVAGDGYAELKAALPPPERRGLVLIDPPYEDADEFTTLLAAFREAQRRWATGTYLLWYPILTAVQRDAVHRRLAALEVPKLLVAELAVYPDDARAGLAGSGLAIVNPPFGADEFLAEAYAALHARLAEERCGYVRVARLTEERPRA